MTSRPKSIIGFGFLVSLAVAGCLRGDIACDPPGAGVANVVAPPGELDWEADWAGHHGYLNVSAGDDVVHLRAYGCDHDLDYRWVVTRGDGMVVVQADGRITEIPLGAAGDYRVHLDIFDHGRSVAYGQDLNTTIIVAQLIDSWTVPATEVDEDLRLPTTCCPSHIFFGFGGRFTGQPTIPGSSELLNLSDNVAVVDASGRILAQAPEWIALRWDLEDTPPEWARGTDWRDLRLRVLRHDGLGATAGGEWDLVYQIAYDNDSEDRWAALQAS